MKSLGIKYQLRIITIIPVFLVALLFAVFYNMQYDKALNQHVARLGRALISPLVPVAQQAILGNDPQTLQKLIESSQSNLDIQSLAFYDEKGQLLAYRGDKRILLDSFKPPSVSVDYIVSRQLPHHSMNFIAPINVPQFNPEHSFGPIAFDIHEKLGWISMDMDIKFILIKRYQMYIVTIFITLAGLLIGLSTHYMLSRRIYRPITRLRRSMKQILNNEFETAIKASSKGELGIIEKGCVHLQKQYINTLQDMNQSIEIATADLQQSLELLEEKNIELSLDKKKTEERSRQKSEFIGNMSHEIRTPMNGVIGFTNVLLESQLDPLQLDYVKTIKSSAQDLLVIINDILDYSKIDAGKLLLDCIPLNIRTCIDDVLTLAAPAAHRKGIDLIPTTAIDVPNTVLGDPIRIKQIISSLVSNAVKFTDYGYVLIRTHVDQETEKDYTLCFSIIDTGIGITAEDQTTLFNAFNQANTTITRRYGGSGLGLVICKKLAERMKGRIVIDSEPHKGSTFSVYLTLEKLAAYEVEKHQTHRFANLKALCFDDNPLHLEALCNGLGYWNIQCIRVNAFSQLESTFTAHKDCQLAFVNVNQGCEQQVAQVLRKQSIPCLLISKWFIQDYQALGAQGFLFKPPNIQKLHDAIELVLNQSANNQSSHQELASLRTQLGKAHPNLLIAEDNPVNRQLLNSFLGKHAGIDTAEDGEQTVAICQQKRFSVILLDLQMPKLNGLDSARLIRQESMLNKNTPIILISANASDIDKETLQKVGVDLCLQKPIDEKQLLQHLLQLMKKTTTSAIDWALCVKKVSGNHELAVEFLSHFIDELELNKTEFLQLMDEQNIQGLESLAHKLHGACCFCGVTQLQQDVAIFERLAATVNHVDAIQVEFFKLITSIEAVLNEYKTLHT